MYKAIIVDDEILSRFGMVNLVDWEKGGFQIVADPSNGEEALEIVLAGDIDLIVTDIKMPIMDGIELLRRAKEGGFDGECIVLSSFDDYAYVREAMLLGAMDYILKLDMKKEQLEDLLLNARESLDHKKNNASNKSVVNKDLLANARREVLKLMLFGRIPQDQNSNLLMKECGLILGNGDYSVLMFKVEKLDTLLGEGSIRQVIDSALDDNPYSYLIDTGIDEMCVLCNLKGKSTRELQQHIRQLAQRIVYIMNQYFNQQVQVFVSNHHNFLSEIPLAYLEVCQAYSIKGYANDTSIVTLGDVMENRNYADYQTLEKYTETIESALHKSDVLLFNQSFELFIAYIRDAKYVELSQIRHATSSLIFIINKYLSRIDIDQSVIWTDVEERALLSEGIQRKSHFLEFLKITKERLTNLLEDVDENHIVRGVKRYLHQHYRETIVIKDLPTSFGVTSAYLSMLFKKETGETLKEYLISMKIDKSKELLRNTSMQIIEIADYVGYDNEHYFSRLFKQKTSVTPSRYRNSISAQK